MNLYALLPFLLQVLAWPLAHAIFRISGSFSVQGYEHIKDIRGPVVFAANHVNDLDPVLTRAMLPWFSKPLFWVARFRKDYDTYADNPFRGWRGVLYTDWFFRSWGAYPAYKGTGDYEKSLRHHLKLLRSGYSVCIFPQGGQAKFVGEGAPARGGAVFLAQHMNVPLVPIAIKGTHKVGPKQLFLERTEFEIFILPPVIVGKEVTEYKHEAQKIMRTVWERVYQHAI